MFVIPNEKALFNASCNVIRIIRLSIFNFWSFVTITVHPDPSRSQFHLDAFPNLHALTRLTDCSSYPTRRMIVRYFENTPGYQLHQILGLWQDDITSSFTIAHQSCVGPLITGELLSELHNYRETKKQSLISKQNEQQIRFENGQVCSSACRSSWRIEIAGMEGEKGPEIFCHDVAEYSPFHRMKKPICTTK